MTAAAVIRHVEEPMLAERPMIVEQLAEVSAARVTERGTRADDKASEAAMEDRKKAGYF